jgi:hypothetical protein
LVSHRCGRELAVSAIAATIGVIVYALMHLRVVGLAIIVALLGARCCWRWCAG